MSRVRLGGEPQEIRAGAKAGFQLCRLPVRLSSRSGQTHLRGLGSSELQNQLSPIQDQLLSETTRALDRPHSNRKAGAFWPSVHETHSVAPEEPLAHPGVVREDHPNSQVSSSSLWWFREENVLPCQSLHPLRHAIQIFTDASNEGWGAHLADYTARGGWFVPERELELKAVLLALKEFEPLYRGWVVLVATDNTTMVAYINKEGGMRSGSLCALLSRCNLLEVCLRARHIPGQLNVLSNKLSRHWQVIRME